MKKKLLTLLVITAMLAFISCDTKQDSKKSSPSIGITGDDDDDDDDDDDGGNPPPTTTGCTGTTSDGIGDGGSIFTQDLFLAGGQSWTPGDYTNPLATQTMPSIQNASLLFKSDARVKVRFKINSQPTPPQATGSTDEFCYGRVYPGALDANLYTKLKFQVKLRDVLCDTPDPNNSNNCASGFYLGAPYQAQTSQPVNVDSCSQVFDIGARRNQTQFGTVVEVADVRSDQTCLANGSFCPAGQSVRPQSCWHMTMQISTDYTQDLPFFFKNFIKLIS
jgi:hypothetical protein